MIGLYCLWGGRDNICLEYFLCVVYKMAKKFSALNLIDLKHNLKTLSLENEITTNITSKLGEIPNLQGLKLDPELILLVCNCIENEVAQNGLKKVNKKDLATKIMSHLFELTDADKEHISKTIEFIWQNGQIKKINSARIAFGVVGDWFARKFL